MPLGQELTDEICWLAYTEPPAVVAQLWDACGVRLDEVQAFARQLLESRIKSVDAFIEKQPHLERCGKLLIAYELCRREQPTSVVALGIEDDWYSLLWDRMHTGTTTLKQVLNNAIRFITFNYDRSLEYFLYQALTNSFGISDWEAAAVVRRLKILHLYGSLGAFTLVSGGRSYKSAVTETNSGLQQTR